ncbi:kinase [Luteimonas sp. RD2P54]|uniref:Kinase n=1 Tax=Luteimonas endophytica TaxID=3042023 RepID=A0ABT6J9K9_9GAMM|nr:kinase [Luteimonas endophytica]MDH5823509.1 kinase [Luteimonas endophytica]
MAQAAHPSGPGGFPPALVERVLADALRPGIRVYGIGGLQGTGKSTLAAQLVEAAAARGVRAAALSIDDFYFDRPAREALARRVHPLLVTRGPPGTHDLALALRTLDALRRREPVSLPRFDKLGDRRRAQALWPAAGALDLVLFEGWLLGTPAEDRAALATPINALEREEDGDGRWRRWCNDALDRDYLALWARIDRLLFLQPPGFEVVPRWRLEQERALQRAEPGRAGMDQAAIARFVQHYERVGRHALRTLPGIAPATIALDAERRPLSG